MSDYSVSKVYGKRSVLCAADSPIEHQRLPAFRHGQRASDALLMAQLTTGACSRADMLRPKEIGRPVIIRICGLRHSFPRRC
jgi:hypothetical protein